MTQLHSTTQPSPHPLCAIALYAVAHRHSWGTAAARRYAAKHGALGLYRLACQLEAVA